MKLSRTKLLIIYFVGVVIYWAVNFFINNKEPNSATYLYQFFFGLIPLVGGITGLLTVARAWGGFRSHLGRALSFLSLGLITWGIGQMFWSYYTVFQIAEVPYPSWADAGYVLSWPLWIIGMVNLSLATGVKFGLRQLKGKVALFVIPAIAIAISYWLLFLVARGGEVATGEGALKLFFDFAYPLGDVAILTLTLLVFGLSFNYLGGKFKPSILAIIAGFVLNYFTDFTFSYTTTQETYYNGHWVDLMFPTVMFLLAYGILSFDPKRIKQQGAAGEKN
jgi:hypothetical protein